MTQALYEEAKRILPSYPLQVTKLKLFQGEGSKKALWRISSPQGEYLLKRSHYPPEKILFSIYGQLHCLEKGARVPAIMKTKDGLPYVNNNGTVYIIYEWFPNARNPVFAQKEELKQTVIALAQFHRTLEGYIPPVVCNEKWRIGKGTRGYEKSINRMFELLQTLKKNKSNNYKHLIDYLPVAINQSKQILDNLNQTGFDEAIHTVRTRRLLTHEDFGAPNALIVDQKGYVIDIDGLAYNLPSRELAKIIIKGIRKQGFKVDTVKKIIKWYEQENPLTQQEMEIMLLEMSFPHQFIRIINSDLRDGMISIRNYSKVIEFEDRKRNLLASVQL